MRAQASTMSLSKQINATLKHSQPINPDNTNHHNKNNDHTKLKHPHRNHDENTPRNLMKCNTNTSRNDQCLLASTIQFSNNHATPADGTGPTPHAPEPEGPTRLAVAIREPNSAPHTTHVP